jgi:uncharacterized membrane protein YjjP (DUF1212 family)
MKLILEICTLLGGLSALFYFGEHLHRARENRATPIELGKADYHFQLPPRSKERWPFWTIIGGLCGVLSGYAAFAFGVFGFTVIFFAALVVSTVGYLADNYYLSVFGLLIGVIFGGWCIIWRLLDVGIDFPNRLEGFTSTSFSLIIAVLSGLGFGYAADKLFR